jgi:hypothetical protein
MSSLLDLIQIIMISKNEIMLGDWNLNSFQNIVDYGSVPKQLLLIEVVDEEGLMLLDVSPSH